MASDLSKEIATKLFTNGFNETADRLQLMRKGEDREHGLGGYNLRAVASVLDAEFTEVRAVLSLTADRRIPEHGHCWCRKDLTNDAEAHNEFCQRARALYERLDPNGPQR